MTLAYYRCDWAHAVNDDPIVILYEVDIEGRVLRMIEIFEDGQRSCLSTVDFAGRENEMPGFNSLVEGDFRESVDEMLEGPGIYADGDRITLAQSDRRAFETEWLEYRQERP